MEKAPGHEVYNAYWAFVWEELRMIKVALRDRELCRGKGQETCSGLKERRKTLTGKRVERMRFVPAPLCRLIFPFSLSSR